MRWQSATGLRTAGGSILSALEQNSLVCCTSGVEAGAADASPSKFFRQIWAKFGQIKLKFD